MEVKPLMDAIDRYLAKADDDLEKSLKDEGFADPKKTVSAINSFEEEVAEILSYQTEALVLAIAEVAENNLQSAVDEMLANDGIAGEIEQASLEMYEQQVPEFASAYLKESDGELVVDTLRDRTSAWISQWSARLGELTRISTHAQITSLIKQTVDTGTSIADLTRKIQQGGWRSEYYQARRFALTEVLRAHSVAREESIQQSPSTDRKEWKHSGTAKIKPRENHVAMDGQIVPKNETFVLIGADGVTYYPMFPRDPILPASESVNCHCTHRGVASDNALGMSSAEKKKLQQAYVESDNDAWKKELDAKNKAKAGIDVSVESESSKVKAEYQASVINKKLVNSAAYRRKYSALPETKKVQRLVSSSAKEMLKHRSGTLYEDLAFIDTSTGKVLKQTNSLLKEKVKPTKAMLKMVKDTDGTIIGVHNHPNSSVPSLDDLITSVERKYKYGIAACHDGTVYKYHVSGELNEPLADGGLDLLQRVQYIEDEQERAEMLERALSVLKDSNVEMEVF